MRINLGQGKLIITFKYNARILPVIRSIPGRQFNLNKKRWEVPIENAAEAVDLLAPLGFTPTLDVKRAADAQRRQSEAADEIRTTPIADYDGDLPLFDFQKIGVTFLKTIPNVLLADSMGTGKSIQAIAATEGQDKILIIVPKSLLYNWKEEISKWLPNSKIFIVDGTKQERLNIYNQIKAEKEKFYLLIGYETARVDIEILLALLENLDTIILDEATKISNPRTKLYKALSKIQAKKKIALTGTPIQNSPLDIYGILSILSPNYLGNYWQFTEAYCIREPRFHRIVGYKNLTELGNRINRFMLRRTKEEVLKDLPPKIYQDVVFQLSVDEQKRYDAIRCLIAEEVAKLLINPRTMNLIPVRMIRLRQLADHPSLITGKDEYSSKFEVLKDILEPIIASEKVVIFSEFAQMCLLLKEKLKIYNPAIIIGELNSEERQKELEKFKDDLTCRILVSSSAGAYGLNLQTISSYLIHYDFCWSISKLLQREDRIHRIGTPKPVNIISLIGKGTLDEYVSKVLHKKQKMSVDILKDEERLEDIGMSEEDIKAILRI